MNASFVTVENLTKLFPIRRRFFGKAKEFVYAVQNVSFSIKKGTIFGLAGESGCGKTTCGKLLVKLLEPTSGMISINSTNIDTLKRQELKQFRRKVQMIFQDPYESINPRLTIFDTIAEPLVVQGIGDLIEREERIREALEMVELIPAEDFFFRFPHELSGGQRQRVAIARALVIGPEFIVADEPVSMLDASIRAGLMNLMLDLKDQLDLTYLFITHDLAVARYICDEMAVMYLGKIAEIGQTEQIIQSPKHPYTKALISAVPVPNPRVKRPPPEIKGRVTAPINPAPGCRFAPRCPIAQEICTKEEPPMVETGKGHFAACHFV
ncbi:MAG: ABC transporter ATP-binding protein [Candidatus Tectomicrobia bacterium]|nr:ABC transporter ATP-binding protein [Candidatus Tectomicrobia bacterium]